MTGTTERRGDPAATVLALVGVVLVVALLASRVRLVAVFGGSWTDEDQTLLWFASRELASFRVHEPYFFGQPYGSWLEALVAAPLGAAGVPYRLALPIAGSILGTVPWLAFACVAWWVRRSPIAATAILGAALVMSVEGTIVTTMPRGLLPGVVLGCLGACAVLTWPRSPVALWGFGALVVVAASMNVGSALVTAPVGVWVGLSTLRNAKGRARRLAALAGGVAVGAVAHVAAQGFYERHPAALVHQAPAIGWSADRASENLGQLARYVTAYAPEASRGWAVVVAAVVLVAAWVTSTRRTVEAAAAVSAGLLLSVAILGAAKANDGAASIFFPFSRIALALPWMVCALSVLPRSGRESPPHAPVDRRIVVACAGLAVVALVGAGARELRLDRRLDELVAAADRQPPVAPSRTAEVDHRCTLRGDAARAHGVTAVLDRYDRTATYGCAALLPRSVLTLFPEYDRRSWVQRDAERRAVERVLVSGLDECPPSPLDCTLIDEADRLYLVAGAARPVTTWATDLGLPLRPLPG